MFKGVITSFVMVCIFISVFFLAGVFGVKASPLAQAGGTLGFEPAALGLKPDETASVVLQFQNVEQVYGVEIHLSFDPQVVEVVDANPQTPEVDLLPADWLAGGFVAQNRVDNTAGKIDFAATLLNPAEPVGGNQAVATLHLKGVKNGQSPLVIDQAILANRDATVLAAEVHNGLVGVSAQGTAPDLSSASTTVNAAPTYTLVLIAAVAVSALVFMGALAFLVVVLRQKKAPSEPAAPSGGSDERKD